MSLYCPLYNHLFIHVPKCAGTSMAAAMETAGSPPSDGHRTLGEYIVEGDLPSDIFKWCFVRNPYDRLFSAYLYLQAGSKRKPAMRWLGVIESGQRVLHAGQQPGPSELDDELSSLYNQYRTPMTSFESYVLNLKEIKKMSINHLKEQHSFISFENITMDFIGRYETIEQDWNYISNKLYNRKIHLHTLNDSLEYVKAAHESDKIVDHLPMEFKPKNKNYMSRYTPEMIKVVNEVYSKDFELFGYTRY